MPKKKDTRKALLETAKKIEADVADLEKAARKEYPDRAFPAGYFGSIKSNLDSIKRCVKADIDGLPW